MAGHAPKHGGEDWRQRLRRASYRGASFWVESDELHGGRRLVVHEFPLCELPYNEDMGQQARRYELDAYVVGGHADSEAVALITACTTRGPGTLVMPLFGTVFARCLEVTTRREKDRQGFVAFRLRFVGDDLALSALGGTPNLQAQVYAGAQDMPPALLAAFQTNYLAVGVPDWVVASAVGTQRDWLAQFDEVVNSSELDTDLASGIHAKAQALYDNAEELLAVGSTGNTFSQTTFTTTEQSVTAKPLVDAVTGLLADYVDAAPAENAVTGLLTLIGFGASVLPTPTTTLNRKRETLNRETLVQLFTHSALAQLASATVSSSYPSRREAIAARASIAEEFNDALDVIVDPSLWEVVQALRNLQGKTIEFLTKLITDLAPVLMIEARSLMPTVYWSYRLYGDTERDEDLWQRNGIKHPMWTPVQFEALARTKA